MRDVRGTSTWPIQRNRNIKTKQKLTGLSFRASNEKKVSNEKKR
jgi:hypothetical protein